MNTTSIHAEMLLTPYSAYDVTIENETVHVIAHSRSAAKYRAFNELELGEYITYEEFIKNKAYAIKTHCTGPSKLKDLFMNDDSLGYCRVYRQLPWLKLGMKIDWCNQTAYIVGGSDIFKYNAYCKECEKWYQKHYVRKKVIKNRNN